MLTAEESGPPRDGALLAALRQTLVPVTSGCEVPSSPPGAPQLVPVSGARWGAARRTPRGSPGRGGHGAARARRGTARDATEAAATRDRQPQLEKR